MRGYVRALSLFVFYRYQSLRASHDLWPQACVSIPDSWAVRMFMNGCKAAEDHRTSASASKNAVSIDSLALEATAPVSPSYAAFTTWAKKSTRSAKTWRGGQRKIHGGWGQEVGR